MPLKLIFLNVNRNFFPDHSATSQLLSDLVFALQSKSHSVYVITARQIYDAPSKSLSARETIAGVTIIRVWTTQDQPAGRAIDYLTSYLTAAWAPLGLTRRGNINCREN